MLKVDVGKDSLQTPNKIKIDYINIGQSYFKT